jgi:hypothetical protein
MQIDRLDDTQYGLLFDTRRSARYHRRRQSFFENLHRVTCVLTILLSGGVLFEIAGAAGTALWLQCLGVFAALLATLDMVVGYSASASQHALLHSRWLELEMLMLKGDLSPATWEGYALRRLEIERDEPRVYRALDLLCYNEILASEGMRRENPEYAEHFAAVGWIKRLTCQWYTWPDIAHA